MIPKHDPESMRGCLVVVANPDRTASKRFLDAIRSSVVPATKTILFDKFEDLTKELAVT